ncbi:CoA transferase [Pusillimonas sp. MFBS29]|uniref:CaiB/BaiF CoA transferase family protein n=1 Tax=Pusillimonas sp. MFBS29 TaxID=2886690 RepID=UPI001D112C5B|nr:CoA transferase [Pusillimonas sp. MFBS29]MCC2594855.1 CoA transferase [Pusillimonas sp. MFBS29]
MTTEPNRQQKSGNPHPGPLSGVRVVDLTSVVLGPLATQLLADFGADVIKVEGPAGDIIRSNGVSRKKGMGSIYLSLNRNKRSMVLDLKQEEDKEALAALIKSADVVVHNMRIKAIERLSFGYDAVKALNPSIVYCAATGFGQDGPFKDKPAFDDIIQASCGFVGVSSLGKEIPEYSPNLIADKTVGLYVSNAILAALFHRQQSGQGQYIEVPMLETMTSFVLSEHMAGLAFPDSNEPAGYKRIVNGGRRPYRTRDGWVGVLPYTEKHWNAFFNAVGKGELIKQFDIADRHKRNARIQEIYAMIAEITPLKTTDEWIAICSELDIPVTRLYALEELPEHPHLKAVDFFQEGEHPTVGHIRQFRPSVRFSETPVSIYKHAPELGEHTQEILDEIRPGSGQ